MSKSRYENKTSYDPGRFRYRVAFLKEFAAYLPDGSIETSYGPIFSTRAIKEPVTRRFSIFGNMELQAGVTVNNDYWYFIIRFISVNGNFKPTRDLLLQAPDGNYTITEVTELDEPPNYWKLLCTKTDRDIVYE